MKNSLVLLLVTVSSIYTLHAQKNNDTQTTGSQNSSIPDKWKNETAVILDQTITYAYYNSSAFFSSNVSNVVKETISRRIKLLDKSAVKDFSEFYFYESEGDARKRESNAKKGIEESRVKISVIKSTGERVKVNISDAVEVTEDVPRFYRSYYMGNKKYKKIAIPNLNVGDVMDYQLSIDYEVFIDYRYNTYHAFPAFNNTLATKYAVMRQEYNFMLESGFCLNMNTYNGAPNYNLLKYGYDFKGKKTDNMRTFQIVDTDRDKLPEEMMSLPLTQYPSIKFQVVANLKTSRGTEGSIFIGEKDAIKNTVEPEEVAERFNEDFKASYRNVPLGKFSLWMKKKKIESLGIEAQARAIYGYVKDQYVYKLTERNMMSAESQTFLYKYERASYGIKDFYFAVFMSRCLDETDIDYEVIAVMPRNTGKIKDLLLGSEVTWIVKVDNPKGQPIYLYPMMGYQTSDVNTDPYLYGGEGYSFIPTRKTWGKKAIVANKVAIPVPDVAANTLKTKMVAAFDDQLEKLTMERTTSATGIFKTNYIGYTTLSYSFLDTYEKEYSADYDEAENQAYEEKEAARKKKKKSKDDIKDEEDFKFLVDKRKELMAAELKDDHDDIASYDSFRLINPGIIDREPALVFNEKFKLNNLISKAGRNYTLEIGKILTKQPKLDENNLKPRQAEIQINYPKTIVYEVELTLPTGYTIEDLKDLNMNLDNEMMSFKVESQLVGDKLMVKTTKLYKKITAPKTEWQKMVDVFTMAYDFSQKKVVLKKK